MLVQYSCKCYGFDMALIWIQMPNPQQSCMCIEPCQHWGGILQYLDFYYCLLHILLQKLHQENYRKDNLYSFTLSMFCINLILILFFASICWKEKPLLSQTPKIRMDVCKEQTENTGIEFLFLSKLLKLNPYL